MFDPEKFKAQLFSIDEKNFEENALAVFQYQWQHNPIYRSYCDHLHIDPKKVDFVGKIPFLPIEFFKSEKVISGDFIPEKTFKSSGTTSSSRSKHQVKQLSFYHHVAKVAFEKQYGDLAQWEILALLPSYLEQGDSSLVSMIDYFIRHSTESSRFLLSDFQTFEHSIKQTTPHKRLIIGVSYALLDFGEQLTSECHADLIMETGGMKGRRKEITRKELHEQLCHYYNQAIIHSEYGMTELLSQAYGYDGRFTMPDWCKVLIREINDPFTYLDAGKTGGINVIDLANVDSCAFLETKDLGKMHDTTQFEVLGRFDNSDIRGCNLLV